MRTPAMTPRCGTLGRAFSLHARRGSPAVCHGPSFHTTMSDTQTTLTEYDETPEPGSDADRTAETSADIERLVDRLDEFEATIERTIDGLEYVVENLNDLDRDDVEADDSGSQTTPDERSELAYQ